MINFELKLVVKHNAFTVQVWYPGLETFLPGKPSTTELLTDIIKQKISEGWEPRVALGLPPEGDFQVYAKARLDEHNLLEFQGVTTKPLQQEGEQCPAVN